MMSHTEPRWTMAAEWVEHERTWMAWPSGSYTLGDTAAAADEARATWAAVANAVAEFEPVSMIVTSSEVAIARRLVAADVQIHVADLDDAWMRDIGPTFVRDDDGSVAAVDWVFNGWGQQEWASWEHDREIGRIVAGLAGVPVVSSDLVNEGGGIHVDGEGTVLATRSVQLDPHRNPGKTAEDVEREFGRTLGTSTTIWLPRGLTRDSEEFGTRGHVDIVATFTSPGRILLHEQRYAGHPDHAVMAEITDALREQTDAAGRRLDIVGLPAPTTLRDSDGFVDYSYVNHSLVNGGVIACSFGDPADDAAVALLAESYPGRRVVSVDARPLFARGGGIHCITQHQPAAR
jgi:agmatine deiminase